jgi:ribonucleoside-triphosphate reductase
LNLLSVAKTAQWLLKSLDEVSMWEQLSLASLAQRYWADNQVSCTVTFDPETEGPQIAPALDIFQYQLKGISFLPKLDFGAYPQMPYESIDADTYHQMKAELGKLSFGRIKGEEVVVERFCDSDVCQIDFVSESSDSEEASTIKEVIAAASESAVSQADKQTV